MCDTELILFRRCSWLFRQKSRRFFSAFFTTPVAHRGSRFTRPKENPAPTAEVGKTWIYSGGCLGGGRFIANPDILLVCSTIFSCKLLTPNFFERRSTLTYFLNGLKPPQGGPLLVLNRVVVFFHPRQTHLFLAIYRGYTCHPIYKDRKGPPLAPILGCPRKLGSLGSVGYNPNIPHLSVGEKTH